MYYTVVCTGVLWDIPSVLVYYILSQIPSWGNMYHPKIRAGVLCSIPGHVLVHSGLGLGRKTSLKAVTPSEWSDEALHSGKRV